MRLDICTNSATEFLTSTHVLSAALLAMVLPLVIGAQPMPLDSPERVRGGFRVVELRNQPTHEEVEAARVAYRQGHIVRLTNASDELVRKIAAGAARIKHGQPDASVLARSRAKNPAVRTVKVESAEISERLVALRVDERGALHQFTSEIAKNTPFHIRAQAEASYRQWELSQAQAGEGPSAPPASWTLVNAQVSRSSTDQGSVQFAIGVYRLNATDKSADYWMVLTDPTATPNFTTPNDAGGCASAFLSKCGWYTGEREIDISTSPAGILLDHGPTTIVKSSEAGFSIGADLGKEGLALSGEYEQTWSQEAVETHDTSNTTTGVAHWTEDFTGESATSSLQPTSINTFTSHQGAIFQMPFGKPFSLSATQTTKFRYGTGLTKDGVATNEASVGSYVYLTLTPPKLTVLPASIKIAPGGSGSFQVFADIVGGDLGLPWNIKNVPFWANVSLASGAASRVITVNVDPETPLGSTGTLNIDTDNKYASPTVADGPLTVQIKVGQPDLHGALLVGGATVYNSAYASALRSAEVYGTTANDVVGIAELNQPRSWHTSTPLLDGTILVTGGLASSDLSSALANAEIYDPATASFTALSGTARCPGTPGCMQTAGFGRVGVRLSDGTVLITGGSTDGSTCLAAAEVYNPATRAFTAVGNMKAPRCAHTATLQPDNRVLISGGFSDPINPDLAAVAAEFFDPANGTFSVAQLPPANAAFYGTATQMDNGTLLVGGFRTNEYGSSELIDSGSVYNGFGPVSASAKLNQPRAFHTATRLQDGRVLIAGGRADDVVATAEIYDPATNTFKLLSGSGACPGAAGCMLVARWLHTATPLLDGRVLLSGGVGTDESTGLQATEIFDPKTEMFSSGPLFDGRVSHTSAQLRAPSALAIQSSANPSTSGQSVVLTATFSVSYPAALSRSGKVTFYDGTAVLGSSLISNGAAQLAVRLENGTHNITASFPGDDSYGASTSPALVQKVNATSATVTLSSNHNPAQYGAAVTFTAQLSGQGSVAPTGTVRFLDNGTVIGSVPITQTTVMLTVTTLSAGTHSIIASYGGDSNYAGDDSNVLTQIVNGVETQTTVTSSANPVNVGAAVTFTAKVSFAQASGAAPTGLVTFADAGTGLSAVNLVNGTATFTTSTLTQGPHQITASYSGDDIYAASSSPALALTVGAISTTVKLVSATNPTTVGANAVFTATVQSGSATPTGSVSFLDGSTTLGSIPLTNGAATFNTTTLSVGTHNITAVYSGDSKHPGATSNVVQQQVTQIGVSISLSSNANPSNLNDPVKFTAVVSSKNGIPTGSITFLDGTSTLGTVSLNSGSAALTTSTLARGSHNVTAKYSGGGDMQSRTSSVLTQVVRCATTTTIQSSAPNPSIAGQEVIFTVNVTSPCGTPPSGSITVGESGSGGFVSYGMAPLLNGVAKVSGKNMPDGARNVNATYGGDDQQVYTGSTSPFYVQTINPAARR